MPKFTSEAGVAVFLRDYCSRRFASTKHTGEMTDQEAAVLREIESAFATNRRMLEVE